MSRRDAFLIRVDPVLLDALRRWAADELRSVNGQVEFVLRRALSEAGRLAGEAGGKPPRAPRDES